MEKCYINSYVDYTNENAVWIPQTLRCLRGTTSGKENHKLSFLQVIALLCINLHSIWTNHLVQYGLLEALLNIFSFFTITYSCKFITMFFSGRTFFYSVMVTKHFLKILFQVSPWLRMVEHLVINAAFPLCPFSYTALPLQVCLKHMTVNWKIQSGIFNLTDIEN